MSASTPTASPRTAFRPLPGLSRRNLGTEVLAGVTLLSIAVPLNIGYAQIAGLPPTAGLYALVLPTLVYALTVSSRQLVASPDAAAAALVASSVGGLAVAGSATYAAMALAQALIGGVMLLGAAAFKLGFLASFLSAPILVGFVGGLALDILVSQVAKMLGVPIASGGEFVEKLGDLVGGFGEIDVWSVVLSVVALAVLIGGRRLARGVPWALVALVVATVAVAALHLDEAGVAVLGPVPAGPPRLTWPVLSLTQWLALVPSALALTLVTMAEGLLVARSYAERRHYPVSANRDLAAFGFANLAAGVTGGFTVGSSTSRTAAMDQAGSRTQLPSVVLAAGTLLLLVFGTGLLALIPSPAVGAVVAVAVLPLLGIGEFLALWRADRFEFAIGAVCFLVTLLVGAIPGILVAFVLALINLARRASTPVVGVVEAPGEVPASAVLVVRVGGPLFFANAASVVDEIETAVTDAASRRISHLVLDIEAVSDVDVTAAESFRGLRAWVAARGISLDFSRAAPATVTRLEHLDLVGTSRMFPTNRAAVAALAPPSEGSA